MKVDLAKEWLSSEGYKYDVDGDGDIHFKYQGKNFFFTSDGDEQFFRIIMPNIYDVDNDREKVLEVCNDITANLKVGKAFLVGDHMWLSIEMFLDSTPEVGDFFERCLEILMAAYGKAAHDICD